MSKVVVFIWTLKFQITSSYLKILKFKFLYLAIWHGVCKLYGKPWSGSAVKKTFSYATQLSKKFILLTNVKLEIYHAHNNVLAFWHLLAR